MEEQNKQPAIEEERLREARARTEMVRKQMARELREVRARARCGLPDDREVVVIV